MSLRSTLLSIASCGQHFSKKSHRSWLQRTAPTGFLEFSRSVTHCILVREIYRPYEDCQSQVNSVFGFRILPVTESTKGRLNGLCCLTLYQFKVKHLNEGVTNEPTSASSWCQLVQSNVKLYNQISVSYISFGLLVVLTVLLIVCEYFVQRKSKSAWYHFSIPMIFHPHSHTNRFESAAVFGLLALEILQIVDEFMTNEEKHSRNAPLFDLFMQMITGLLLGLRYFPLLAVFEQKRIGSHRLLSILYYGFASIYFCGEILFKLLSDIRCPNQEKQSAITQDVLSRFNATGIDLRQYLGLKLGKWGWLEKIGVLH